MEFYYSWGHSFTNTHLEVVYDPWGLLGSLRFTVYIQTDRPEQTV